MAKTSVTVDNGGLTDYAADVRTTTDSTVRQVMALGTDGDNLAHVEAWGQLHVTQGAATLFYDDFTSAVSSDLWTTSTGTAPSITAGRLVPSATVSTYNFTRSVDLMPNGVGYIDVRMGVQLEATAAVGAGRFWGLGTQATANSATSLVQDGAGFEVDSATGNLMAVVYKAGVRTQIGANLTRPSDGGLHRYSVCHRVTKTFWFIDGYTAAVASVDFADVEVADLPVAIVRRNAASVTGVVFTIIAAFAADTNRDAGMLADSLVPARRARVSDGRLWVDSNAAAKPTYLLTAHQVVTGALTANTRKDVLTLEHAAAATKTVRLRRLTVSGYQSTALAGLVYFAIYRGTAASTAGTALVPLPTNPGGAAAEMTARVIAAGASPTITAAAGPLTSGSGQSLAATANTGFQNVVVYDWQNNGDQEPLLLRAGFLDTLVFAVFSTVAHNLTLQVTATVTEA